jgi:alpha-ketoglutarate-dependent taurine dioxygenase
MLLAGVAILLSSFTLVQAAAIPHTANDTMTASVAAGYKNVAYFVNWVRSLTENFPDPHADIRYRPSTVETSTPRISQPKNLPTSSMPLPMFDQRLEKST